MTAFWDKSTPKGQVHKHLTRKGVEVAKAKARAAGRPYPNLVDNAAAAKAGYTTKGKKK